MDYFIVKSDDPTLCWSKDKGWVSPDDADLFSDEKRRQVSLPEGGEWSEAWDCDGCGELRPEAGGDLSVGWYSSVSIDPPENYWYCAGCVARYEAAEESRAEDMGDLYLYEK